MSNVLVNDTSLTAIANAIRSKLGVSTTYKPGQMASAIQSIPTGGSAVLGTKTITANGTYNASSDNYDGYSQVVANVSGVSWDDLAQGNQPSGLITLTGTSLSKMAMSFMPKNNWQVYSTTITTLNDSCFRESLKLTSVRLPNLTTINIGYTFYQCMDTALIDIGSANQIINYMFQQCSALKTLIIRRSSVCELKAINNFNSTPFASNGTGGTLYVPRNLIASYQAATNWSTILGYTNNSIVALEGSSYENPTGTW